MINVEIDRRGGCIEGETMHSKMPPEPQIPKALVSGMAQEFDIAKLSQYIISNNLKNIRL